MGRGAWAMGLAAALALDGAMPACAVRPIGLDASYSSAMSIAAPSLPSVSLPSPPAAALDLSPLAVPDVWPAVAPSLDVQAPARSDPDVRRPAPKLDAGKPGERFSPALSWSISGASPEAARVRAITSRGETILINGKAAQAFDGRREGQGFVEEIFVHPDDKDVLVRVFHSPSSMAGLERKLDKLQALAPLAEAGAAPRIIEHGEAVVPGKGRVYFLTQERVEGRRLGQVELAASQGAVAELFDRLERAGLALAVPGPDPAWLLSRIMIGRTASAGERAYLLEGELEAKPTESLADHYAMLRSLLTPRQAEEAPPTPEPASVKPAQPAAAKPLGLSATALVGLARSLAELGDPSRKDEPAEPLIRGLIAGLNDSPEQATPGLRDVLAKAISVYWEAFERRRLRAGYFGRIVLPADHIHALADGRNVGAERLTGLIDVYGKLLEARPDLAEGVDVELLTDAFSTRFMGEDPDGDEVLVSELAKLANAARALALARPELLSLDRHARILQGADALSIRDYEPSTHYGDGRKSDVDFYKRAAFYHRLETGLARLRAELDDGFHRAALTAPIERLRATVARFADGRWEPLPGFEARLRRLAEARPELEAALLERDVPASVKEREEARARGDWTRPILHALPIVKGDESRKAALIAARTGWLAYRAAYRGVLAASRTQLFISDPAAFYAQVFGIGQLLGTETALGPKMDLALLTREAEKAAGQFAYSFGWNLEYAFQDFFRSVAREFAQSPNHARKVVQKTLLDASVLLFGQEERLRNMLREWTPSLPDAEQAALIESMRARIKGLLRDFDAGSPSSVAGVLVTGSYAYGKATRESDLDLFILTRPSGKERTREFVEAVQAVGRESRWPAMEILDNHIIAVDGDQAQALRRNVRFIVFSNDPQLADNPAPVEPFDAPSRAERMRNKWDKGSFRKGLIREFAEKGAK